MAVKTNSDRKIKSPRRPRVLYHWSPRKNRARILKLGLQIGRPCRLENWNALYLCFSDNPGSAFFFTKCERGTLLDLYMIEVNPFDKGKWRGKKNEYRIHNDIPRNRVWWIGERRVGWNPNGPAMFRLTASC